MLRLTTSPAAQGILWGSFTAALLSKAICAERQLAAERASHDQERQLWQGRVAAAEATLEAERKVHEQQRQLWFLGGKAYGAVEGFEGNDPAL